MRSKLSNRGGVEELRSEEVGGGDQWGHVWRRGDQQGEPRFPAWRMVRHAFLPDRKYRRNSCELKQMNSFLNPLSLRNQEDTQEGSVS